ncbi:response regulator [Rummeliibacillus pycnus]|uniref:response regulator n=1 Tax=Rummeliibacillus pycnus TaxID=101070 RepID=UPI003D2903DE
MNSTINPPIVQHSKLVEFQEFFRFFNFISNNNKRTKSPLTLIFINIKNTSQKSNLNTSKIEMQYENTNQFLSDTLRGSDILTKLPDYEGWLIMLPNSKELEGIYYLNRINKAREEVLIMQEIKWCSSIVEINNTQASFEEIYIDGTNALKEVLAEEAFSYKAVAKYQIPESDTLKVSIIENDQITNNIFHEMMGKIDVENFELDIRSFFDGQSFLDSSWYHSDHMHLILMNYALPKKNGLQLLHELRSMPNNGKYIIYIISKQQAPEDMIYAYESGVDGFIIKPFNLSVVRAELKQMIKRIRI